MRSLNSLQSVVNLLYAMIFWQEYIYTFSNIGHVIGSRVINAK